MRRLLIPFSGVVLAAVAWTEEPAKPAPSAAAVTAAKTMEAMDAISLKSTKEEAKSTQADGEEDSESGPPLLPLPTADSSRGMDVLSRARLDMMVPTGRSHRGVHYPIYRPVVTERTASDSAPGPVAGVTAPLESLFESDLVTRLDEDHVQFDRAKWVQYEEQMAADGSARPTMTLEIERGVYDLKNEILMTNQPVKIENRQFIIEGDTMLHDRASGLTRLTGRVKLTFFNEESESGAKPAAPGSQPSPTLPAASPQPPRQP